MPSPELDSSWKNWKYVDARNTIWMRIRNLKRKMTEERMAVILSLIGGTYESQGAWEDAIMEYKRSSIHIWKNRRTS